MRVGLIDYGVGNLGSVARALEGLRTQPILIDKACDLRAADRLILPGVGNFADCARILCKGGWTTAIRDAVLGLDKPLLGICLGMQLLGDTSSEGAEVGTAPPQGLALIPGRVEHLRKLGCESLVPHVGWNSVRTNADCGNLFEGIPQDTDFYFVHSYAFVADAPEDVVATVDYGLEFAAAIQRGRVCGTQFHPEKSSKAGFRLLKNFIEEPSC